MKHLLTTLAVLWLSVSAFAAEVPILDRRISVNIVNQSTANALLDISSKGKFNFSYSPQVVKVSKMVNVQASNQTVREILDKMFNGTLTYKQIGNHLVLQKKIPARSSSKVDEKQGKIIRYDAVVNGYIRDAYSGQPLSGVSVYNVSTLANALSGDFGYYKIALISKTPEFELKVSHPDYRDTVYRVAYQEGGVLDMGISLTPLHPQPMQLVDPVYNGEDPVISDTPIVNKVDSLSKDSSEMSRVSKMAWADTLVDKLKAEQTRIGEWVVGTYQKLSNRNIRDSFERDWQVTFLPPLGSNGALSGRVTNKFSLNVLAGYNGGVNGVEFGGLTNIIRTDVQGAQFGGLANIVGRNTRGAQFAGILNQNFGFTEGFQAAGVYNMNMGYTRASQLAGIFNLNASELEGFQAAGIFNLNTSYTRGVQVAGVLNLAKEVDGGQIAGVLNVSRRVRGFQIGLINIADTCEGVAIGIVNFIRSGLHQLEINKNDFDQYGLAYRSGTGKFYSILTLNSRLPINDTATLISYGFSVGTRFRFTKFLHMTLDAGTQHLTYNFRSDHLNLLNRVGLGLELRVFKGFSIFGTANINHMINDVLDPHYEWGFSTLGNNNQIWKDNSGRYLNKVWTGYTFGVRLF